MLHLLAASWLAAAPAHASEVSVGVDLGNVDLVAVFDIGPQPVYRPRPVVVAPAPIIVRRPIPVRGRFVRPTQVVYAAPRVMHPAPVIVKPAPVVVHTPAPAVVHHR